MSFPSFIRGMRTSALVLLPTWLLATGCGGSENANGPTRASSRSPSRVKIQVIKPPVFWCKDRNNPGETEKPLDPDPTRSHGRPSGSWIRCGPGGEARVMNPSWIFFNGQEWWPLPPLAPDEEQAVDEADNGLSRTAGRGRYVDPLKVFSPQKNSLVWPGSLVFRWTPGPAGKKVSLKIEETRSEKVLWEKSGLDAAAGKADDPQARLILQRWRGEHCDDDSPDALTLVFQGEGQPVYVPFGILSAEDGKKLESELAAWDGKGSRGMLRLLDRGAVFYKHKLLPESTAEYEEALRLDPQNPRLIRKVIDANNEIGNLLRARQVEK